MCGFEITKQNPLTMHHIIPKSENGKGTIENSSNVTHLPHSGLHVIYDDDPIKKKQIIDYLRYYKQTKDLLACKQFHDWLINEMINYGYEQYETKDKLLVYKRRIIK